MNKKIGLLTFHCAHNYGAVLQCYSTFRFLEKQGYEPEVINYRNSAIVERYKQKRISFFLNPKNIYRVFKYNSPVVYNHSFETFQERRLSLSKESTEKNIHEFDFPYSSIIVGSDQVWNMSCNGGDTNYFLGFVDKQINKIGLSVSCGGRTDLLLKNKDILSALHDFSSISIREADDCEVLRKQIRKPKLSTTIDPVFLLSKDDWMPLLDDSISKKFENFVFVYMVSEDKDLIRFAKEKHPDRTIVYLNLGLINIRGVNNIRKVSPEQFLSLINNADVVYTNSYHGLAFSIIFGKKFGVKLLNKNKTINNRVLNLLELLSGKSHLIDCLDFDSGGPLSGLETRIESLSNFILNAIDVRKE